VDDVPVLIAVKKNALDLPISKTNMALISESHNALPELLDLAEDGLLYRALVTLAQQDMQRQQHPTSFGHTVLSAGVSDPSLLSGDVPMEATIDSVRVAYSLPFDGHATVGVGHYPVPPAEQPVVWKDENTLAQELGFESATEMHRLVSLVKLETEGELRRFEEWKIHDGTKAGLLRLGL
jgi:hypothetical protein